MSLQMGNELFLRRRMCHNNWFYDEIDAFANDWKSRKLNAKRDLTRHCRRRASPPHPKTMGHFSKDDIL